MDLQELEFVECVIEKGYSPSNQQDVEASTKLSDSMSSVESLEKLFWLISNSQKVKVIIFSCFKFQAVFTEHCTSFVPDEVKKIRQDLLRVLQTRSEWLCSSTEHFFALSALSRLLARIHRLSWFDIVYEIDSEVLEVSQSSSSDILSELLTLTRDISLSVDLKVNIPEALIGTRKSVLDSEDPMLHLVATKMIVEPSSLFSNLVGCYILSDLVEEMGLKLPNRNATYLRKIAISFRDRCLLVIYKNSLQTMRKLLSINPPTRQPMLFQYQELLMKVLQLTQNILSFDFVGTQPEESSDEVGIIHLPSTWGPLISATKTVNTYFEFYSKFEAPLSTKTLEILSYINSVQYSLLGSFTSQQNFLDVVLIGLTNIFQNKIGFNVPDNLHHLCRLLVRLKSNFHMKQFLQLSSWQNFIKEVEKFHFTLIQSPQCTSHIIFYVMIWWSRLSSALSIIISGGHEDLFNTCASLFQCFVESQMQFIFKSKVDETSNDFLLEDKQFSVILNSLSTILERSGNRRPQLFSKINELFLSLLGPFESLSTRPHTDFMELEVYERTLAFIIHIVSINFSDCNVLKFLTELSMDEELKIQKQMEIWRYSLIFGVIYVMQLSDSRLVSFGVTNSTKYIEYAFACFMRRFCNYYFSSEDLEKEKIHNALRQNQLQNSGSVLDIALNKIAMNLKYWSGNTEIAGETLQLFSTISNLVACKFLSKTPLVLHFLSNHNELLLGSSKRNRTEFYRILSKIVFKDAEIALFQMFIEPMDNKLMKISEAIVDWSDPYSEVTQGLIILLADLGGVLNSCTSQDSYELFFEWFYFRGYFRAICKIATGSNWYLVWAILKFVMEFVSSPQKRIHFSPTSTDGMDLYFNVSSMLTQLAQPILKTTEITGRKMDNFMPEDIQAKSTMLYLKCFSVFFDGLVDYCHLGFFKLFDKAYESLFAFLDSAFSITFSINPEVSQEYPKLVEVVYFTLDVVSRYNICELLADENYASRTIYTMLQFLRRGLKNKKIQIICFCTQSIDRIVTHEYESRNRPYRQTSYREIFHEQHNILLMAIMFDLFEILISDRDSIHWTLCRPLFSIIQLLPSMFTRLQQLICESQSHVADRAEHLKNEFEALMNGVDRSLKEENRERFANNAVNFKLACKVHIDFHTLYKHIECLIPPL